MPDHDDASAGAGITGVSGQTFTSGSFTLASARKGQGGSPRFNVVTTNGMTSTTFFLGCNNIVRRSTLTAHGDLQLHRGDNAAGGNQVPFPTSRHHVGRDRARCRGNCRPDRTSRSTARSRTMSPAGVPTTKDQCKHGGWKTFSSPGLQEPGSVRELVACGTRSRVRARPRRRRPITASRPAKRPQATRSSSPPGRKGGRAALDRP